MTEGLEHRYKVYTVGMRDVVAMLNWRQSPNVVCLPNIPELPAGYEVGAAHYDFIYDAVMVRIHHESFPEVPVGMASEPVFPPVSMERIAVLIPKESREAADLVSTSTPTLSE